MLNCCHDCAVANESLTWVRRGFSQSVFGEARPREKIIAEKLGVDENELIKEQASKDFALNVSFRHAYHTQTHIYI